MELPNFCSYNIIRLEHGIFFHCKYNLYSALLPQAPEEHMKGDFLLICQKGKIKY